MDFIFVSETNKQVLNKANYASVSFCSRIIPNLARLQVLYGFVDCRRAIQSIAKPVPPTVRIKRNQSANEGNINIQ